MSSFAVRLSKVSPGWCVFIEQINYFGNCLKVKGISTMFIAANMIDNKPRLDLLPKKLI
jgi:hypothetical protein